jgi:hypothetical protein
MKYRATPGARDTVLQIDIPEPDVAPFEWIEAGKPYREFLVPTRLVNRYGHRCACRSNALH